MSAGHFNRKLAAWCIVALAAAGAGLGNPPPATFAPAPTTVVVPPPLAQATGSIAGSARFSGAAPEAVVLQMAADPYCLAAHDGEAVTAEHLVVNDNGTLRWVFVHIREALAGSLPSGGDAESVVLDQVGCVYRPHVIGIQTGAALRVVNSDTTLHNVNVQPANNPGFNVAQPIPNMAIERRFANPEVMILVRCDVHPWMQAYIGVVPHQFFAVTHEQGSFALDGVPAGEYVVEAWHETLGTRTATVEVRAGEAATVDFDFGTDR